MVKYIHYHIRISLMIKFQIKEVQEQAWNPERQKSDYFILMKTIINTVVKRQTLEANNLSLNLGSDTFMLRQVI